jgi:hypothetical protein
VPEWLNRTAGVLARNGTDSHTLTFGSDGDAPFTPTDGRFLVVVVDGPVTHGWPGGWTERLSPVNTSELSVATATASSTTSVVITHNSGNKPIAFAAYEFPAGTTWVTGGSSADTSPSGACPDLTGLPGTAVSVFSAISIAVPSTASAISAAWTAPATEDADFFAAFSGTDGAWLSVAYEDGVTSTTKSGATLTTTVTGTANNAERVSFALDVPAGSSVDGALAATVPLPAAALAATVTDTGVLAGSVPFPAATLAATITDAAALASTVPLATSSLAGVVSASGAFSAAVPLPIAALVGDGVDTTVEGALSAAVPLPAAGLAATMTASAVLAAAAPLPVASIGTVPDLVLPLRAGTPTIAAAWRAGTPT